MMHVLYMESGHTIDISEPWMAGWK